MKNKFKELASDFKRGVKATAKVVKKYGPGIHKYLKKTASSAYGTAAIHPQRRENLNVNLRPIPERRLHPKRRNIKGKGEYLDFT